MTEAWTTCLDNTCYTVNELCDSEHCNAVVNDCGPFSASEWADSEVLADGTMHATTCTVLSDSRPSSVTSVWYLQEHWAGYAVFYVSDDFTEHPAGALERGYNLLAQRSADGWLEAVQCELDARVEAVAGYNQDHGESVNILSSTQAIQELVDQAGAGCGGTYPLTRIEDPLSESLTIRIGEFSEAF